MQRLIPAADIFSKWLSAEEQKRANRFLLPDKKITSICSRGILRWILASYLDLSPAAVKIDVLPNGKPHLQNSKLQFNLSHSGSYFICAVNLQTPLGIDIQHIYPISGLEKISHSYFNPEQVQQILKLKGQKQLESFFQHWVNLEAYLKAEGDGFQIRPTKKGLVNVIKNGFNRSQSNWHTIKLSAPEGYKAALVTGDESPLILRQSIDYLQF
jgi:4'-phosphopantetheinyl transferase